MQGFWVGFLVWMAMRAWLGIGIAWRALRRGGKHGLCDRIVILSRYERLCGDLVSCLRFSALWALSYGACWVDALLHPAGSLIKDLPFQVAFIFLGIAACELMMALLKLPLAWLHAKHPNGGSTPQVPASSMETRR